MARRIAAVVLFAAAWTETSSPAGADDRWVDDPQVLPPWTIRVRTGLAAGLQAYHQADGAMYYQFGYGLNLEGAVGVGYDVEIGARFATRPFARGRGLRADQVARLIDTETFGTGLSVFPNPEIQVRWRILDWQWLEAGLEDRFVPPMESDRQTSEVVGAWASLRFLDDARLDAGLNGVLTWQSFAQSTVLERGFGVPVRLWANFTETLFVGLVAAVHHFGRTPYTSSATQAIMGLGVGYRIGTCDIMQATYSLDALNGSLSRIGAGAGAACRF